jgi:hypothetical protein
MSADELTKICKRHGITLRKQWKGWARMPWPCGGSVVFKGWPSTEQAVCELLKLRWKITTTYPFLPAGSGMEWCADANMSTEREKWGLARQASSELATVVLLADECASIAAKHGATPDATTGGAA